MKTTIATRFRFVGNPKVIRRHIFATLERDACGMSKRKLSQRRGSPHKSGSHKGPITLPQGSFRHQSWLSVPSDFNKLRPGD